jgi:hypothetical protein
MGGTGGMGGTGSGTGGTGGTGSGCTDGQLNGNETDVDCGGADCPACVIGDDCGAGGDCQSGFCADGVCCNSACTSDCQSCNISGMVGTCSADPNGTACTSDSTFCNGVEECQGGSCVSPGDPCAAPTACVEAADQCVDLWVNELHYDNSGADVGEFVEVAVPSGVTVSSVTVSLYDGNTGTVYDTHALSTFTAGATVNGVTLYSKAITPIDNGSDGVCLDVAGSGFELLSYEGQFTATDGPCNGMTSVDTGVNENGAAAGTSMSLQGTGTTGSDFTWSSGITETPGAENTGQTIN